MTSRSFGSLLFLLPLTLAAQSLQERTVPLNNWPAPRHVHRSQVQPQQRVVTPKFQLPGGTPNDVLVFVPIAPCRLADTRPGSGYPALGSTPLASNTPRTLPIAGSCGVPIPIPTAGNGPEAYSLTVTVVPASGTVGGYLLVYPNPEFPVPVNAVSLTWSPGASYISNAVITAASPDGSVNVVVNSHSDVVIDINGYYAVPSDAFGDTALGSKALASDVATNLSGFGNTAFGNSAMQDNVSGVDNTAVGDGALADSTAGSFNVALGNSALENSFSGSNNTALGTAALVKTGGNNNVAVGYFSGLNLTTGNNNIMIENNGVSSDDHTIRIGDVQTSTYIAGIWGVTPSGGANVVINSNGQLGVEAVSSRRYKEDVQDMGDASQGLLRLRPVTFHYKKPDAEGSKPLEYGLIAEEVADVYPELVIRGADSEIESVQYQKLPAMLLNELQKEHRNAEEQAHRIQQQDETIRKLGARLAALESQSAAATAKVPSDKPLPSPLGEW